MQIRALLGRLRLSQRSLRRLSISTTCLAATVCAHHASVARASAGSCAGESDSWCKPGSWLHSRAVQLRRLWEERADCRATDLLIAVNVAIFLADRLAGGRLMQWGCKNNDLVLRQGQWWRLLTCPFLHANLTHLVMNMCSFNNLNRYESAESAGWKRLLLVCIGGALGGSVCSLIFEPSQSCGASGAVFGLIAATAVLIEDNRAEYDNAEEIVNDLYRNVAIIMAVGLALPGIDNWAHLGGGLAGGLLACLFGPRFRLRMVESTNDKCELDELETASGVSGPGPDQDLVMVDEPRLPLLAARPTGL